MKAATLCALLVLSGCASRATFVVDVVPLTDGSLRVTKCHMMGSGAGGATQCSKSVVQPQAPQ